MPAPTMQSGVFSTTTFNALGTYVDDVRVGIVARGRRTTTSSSTTTEVAVLRIDDIPVLAGRTYKISTSCMSIGSTVNGDIALANIRYTTDGSTPTTSSTALGGLGVQVPSAAIGMAHPFIGYFFPSSDQIFSVLLSVARASGTGSVSIGAVATQVIDLIVEDMGFDTGDVGVDL